MSTENAVGSLHLHSKSVHQGQTLLVVFDAQVPGGTPLPGDAISLRVEREKPTEPPAEELVATPRSFPCGKHFCAFIGVGLDVPTGKASVSLLASDGRILATQLFTVRKNPRPPENLKVDPSRVQLSAADQKRADDEKKRVHDQLDHPRTEMLESTNFLLPVKSAATSAFGKRRFFNGESRGYHNGVDLRAKKGTPITAANSGIVRLADDLFFAGKHVLVDHGGGIFSSYSHLSDIGVREGQRLNAGEEVGKAGATGRVTAAHLHWTVRIEGHAVDPMQFMQVLSQVPNTAPALSVATPKN